MHTVPHTTCHCTGGADTFKDVSKAGPDADHPTCGSVVVTAKLAELCVDKPSCTVDGTQGNGPIDHRTPQPPSLVPGH